MTFIVSKKRKSFFVTDNASSSNLLSVDSSTSLLSENSSFQPVPNLNEPTPISTTVTPRPPTKPKTQLQSSNPRRFVSTQATISKSFEGFHNFNLINNIDIFFLSLIKLDSPETDNIVSSPRTTVSKFASTTITVKKHLLKI